ncbi:hypothetical protein MASR2M29_13830 [Spirochaetota bacterium]
MVNTKPKARVREAISAGIFYPDDPEQLTRMLENTIAKACYAEFAKYERPLAILAPHAAFSFALGTQAAGWKTLLNYKNANPDWSTERFVIISVKHGFSGRQVYLPELDYFDTPLGKLRVDKKACRELESSSTVFTRSYLSHLENNGIELQLPFMRLLFPNAMLVPLLVSGGPQTASALARSLDLCFAGSMDKTMFVISANLASSMDADDAEQRSAEMLKLLTKGQWRDVAARGDIAGSLAMAALLAMNAMAESRYQFICRKSSSAANLNKPGFYNERIVHYASSVWFGRKTHES